MFPRLPLRSLAWVLRRKRARPVRDDDVQAWTYDIALGRCLYGHASRIFFVEQLQFDRSGCGACRTTFSNAGIGEKFSMRTYVMYVDDVNGEVHRRPVF